MKNRKFKIEFEITQKEVDEHNLFTSKEIKDLVKRDLLVFYKVYNLKVKEVKKR